MPDRSDPKHLAAPQGPRVEVNPLAAEAVLKDLMTQVWNAGGGRLSVEVCVDEALRIAKERFGMQVPSAWRDRFVRETQKILDAREKAPPPQMEIVTTDESPEEFEKRVKQASEQAVKVIVNPRKDD